MRGRLRTTQTTRTIATAAIVAVACGLLATSAQACSSSSNDAPPPPAEAGSVLDAAAVVSDAQPDAKTGDKTRCTADNDCRPPNGCYTGHCDVVLGACAYALCEPEGRTCAAGRCDPSTSKCFPPADYSFRATRYKIDGATLGCAANPNASACVAAIYPFVFVGTKDDVLVVLGDDLLATFAATVTHTGAHVVPAQVIASGRRLWIVSPVQGAAAPYQVTLSWIDVPVDPTVTSVSVESTVVSWPFADAFALPAPDGALFLSSANQAAGFPTALMKPPFAAAPTAGVANALDAGGAGSAPTNPMYGVDAPAGSTLVAASGSRLLLERGLLFNVVTGAATPSAKVEADQMIAPPFAAFVPPRFAFGPDGVVLLTAPIIADAPPPDCNCRTDERLQWVLPNAVATNLDAVALDIEGYVSPEMGTTCRVCNPTYVTLPSLSTWIDAKTALVVAAQSGSAAQQTVPAVRVIERDPLAVPANRRFVPAVTETPAGNFATDRIALTSANGFGYLVVADGSGDDVYLSIFDPRCDVKP
jgi:hypothetical protein